MLLSEGGRKSPPVGIHSQELCRGVPVVPQSMRTVLRADSQLLLIGLGFCPFTSGDVSPFPALIFCNGSYRLTRDCIGSVPSSAGIAYA